MYGNSAASTAPVVDQGLREHMSKTYSILSWGLAVTAAGAWATIETSFHEALVGPEGLTGLGYVMMFSPLALLLGMAFGLLAGPASARILYWAFVALQGPGLALFAMQYTGASVANAAAATAMTFGAASLYGYTTKRSLASFGAFLFMGLIGLVATSLLNLFLGSPAISFAVSCAAVLVFTGLAAWETQKLKESYSEGSDEMNSFACYMSALGLYLSILNLFQALLSLTGDRK